MKLTKEVPLSATEEAYLAQVMAGHAAVVESADAKRAEMVAVLLKDKGIPEKTPVRTKAREDDKPAYLVYDVPGPEKPSKSPQSRRRR